MSTIATSTVSMAPAFTAALSSSKPRLPAMALSPALTSRSAPRRQGLWCHAARHLAMAVAVCLARSAPLGCAGCANGSDDAQTQAQLRVLRQGPAAAGGRCHDMHVRVHLLRGLRGQSSAWRALSELRW